MKLFNQKKKWIWESFYSPIFSYNKVDLSYIYYKLGQINTSVEFISEDNYDELLLSLLSKEVLCISELEDTSSSSNYKKSLQKTILDSKEKEAEYLTKEMILSWYEGLFPNKKDTVPSVSSYRTNKEEVEIISYNQDVEKIHFVAPSYKDIDSLVDDFIVWVNSDIQIDVIYKAAIANLWFIMLHPFDDGNGRVSRLISNFILSKNDLTNSSFYFLSSSTSSKLEEYYEVLDEICIQTELDVNLWIKWFVNILNESLSDSINKIELIKIKTIFWNRHKNVSINKRQRIIIHEMLSSLPYNYKGGMKVSKYINIIDTPRITASRDLNDLVKKGFLKSNAKGRNINYTLIV